MSQDRAQGHSSHVVTWLVSLFIVVPLIYLLSVPPVAIYTLRGNRSPNAAPDWLMVYCLPFIWLNHFTPFRKPFQAYGQWWEGITPYEDVL